MSDRRQTKRRNDDFESDRSTRPKLLSVIGSISQTPVDTGRDRNDARYGGQNSRGSNKTSSNNESRNQRNSQRDQMRPRTVTSDYPIHIQTEKPKVQEAHLRPEIMQRNKRLFAGLMGHLDFAKKKLEEDESRLEQRSLISTSAKQRHEVESQKIADIVRQKSEVEARKKLIVREMSTLKTRIADMKRSLTEFKEAILSKKDYLETSTEPCLLWLPTQHNTNTQALIDIRSEQVLSEISTRETVIEEELGLLDKKYHRLQMELEGKLIDEEDDEDIKEGDDIDNQDNLEEEEEEEDVIIDETLTVTIALSDETS